MTRSIDDVNAEFAALLARDSAFDLVREIQALMNGTEWSPDTLDAIAHLLRAGGYEIRDLED